MRPLFYENIDLSVLFLLFIKKFVDFGTFIIDL